MAVSPSELENREGAQRRGGKDASEELERLKAKIEAAKSIKPQTPRERHCINCFQFGRDAAIRAILDEG